MNLGDWLISYTGDYFVPPCYATRDEAVEVGAALYEGESFFVAQVGIIKEEVVDTEYKKGEQ